MTDQKTGVWPAVLQGTTWTTARDFCQDDGGELSCFGSQSERDALADNCDDCWVGYTWQDSKFYTGDYSIVLKTKNLISSLLF